jgi:thioredoxin reductase (NADPH)
MLEERFKELDRKVILEVFVDEGSENPYNILTMLFVNDLARLSDKIEARVNTLDSKKSEKYMVTRSPTVLINPEQYKIRYTGAPVGEEGRSFIETIMLISKGQSGLNEDSRKILDDLSEKRHVQVYVTPGCPYCPNQVLHAFRAAVYRPDMISAECVESTENPDLAKKYNVGAVPHTIINDITVSKGLEPEERFMAELLSLEPAEEWEPTTEPGEIVEVDLIIIGAGPAGLTAAIYGERSGLHSVVLEKEVIGGQVSVTPVVENYPGFSNIPGKKLMDIISSQASNYTHIREGEGVREIKVGRHIEAITSRNNYVGNALIIATGSAHRKLDVPGEAKFSGHGVSYCATCDGYLYKGKKVIMVGGGNNALTDALYLNNLGARVTIVHRRDEFRGEMYLQEAVNRESIPIKWNSIVIKIVGKDDELVGVKLENLQSGEVKNLKVDGVFAAIGEIPNTRLASEIGLKLDESGFIEVDRNCRTNIPRIYAAGDVTGGVRQIVTAVGEGSTAAIAAFEDISHPYWIKNEK